MKALIIGATGATGKDLVNVLLRDPDYSEVVTFVRRASGTVHPKLREIVTDFDKLEAVSEFIKGDVFFNCLGTTLKAAGSQEKQWQIDYEIPARFAEIARKNGVRKAVSVSAYDASSKSKLFYSRMKGQLEDQIASLAFEQDIVFKPGMLLRKDTDRPAERIIAGTLKFLNSLGLIRKFRPLSTELLAEKMAKAPKTLSAGRHVIELDKIFGF
ncbi:NAD-dependent epimerase/dehydratase family protein [Larkinella terrae]|uniref:NAD(P)H-binding protein n=1 Tax=Larkinella terrae TaxID=2025311 RepID=A0A7K0ECG9_9BACT|nr:NAD-dependent epimerase/dehydratase family protein [Larkinella terrae]MRS59670.1 NAD(P)H-binding protein [Larkinella terrae]